MRTVKDDTLLHAMFLARHLGRCDLREGLVYILLELQLPAHNIGYHYVTTAILLFYRNPVRMLMSGIYQEVARSLETSATYQQMEKAIRTAIKQAYESCDPAVWSRYFRLAGRPSNYEFISQIANFLQLWQACCKEVSYETE